MFLYVYPIYIKKNYIYFSVHLLQHKVVSGILLITKHGKEVYTYGELTNLLQVSKLGKDECSQSVSLPKIM